MDYLKIILSSIISLTVLFFSTKIIGNKQMSQLNMFDYINGITIGSIAADMAVDVDGNMMFPIIAMIIYTSANALIAYIGTKNIPARRFLTGKSIVLMDKGKIYNKNFKTAKIDFNEFLTQCRINGFFNLDDIETAILEQNGMISFLPRSSSRPVTTSDINAVPGPERPFYCVISDGTILHENVAATNTSIDNLHRALDNRNIAISNIFAALYDGKTLLIYPKQTDGPKNDISQ